MKEQLSSDDLSRIQQAVAEAEQRTSGEIVPYVVPRSDTYEGIVWKGAGIAAAPGAGLYGCDIPVLRRMGTGVAPYGLGNRYAGAGCRHGRRSVSAFAPPIGRMLAGSASLTRAVHRRAMKAFVEEEVFATRERTGVLIFISLWEHRIEVLGDAGI